MWTDQDRVDALVWAQEQADKLPCGHSKSESMHPDNEDAYEVTRMVCHACRAVYEDVDRLEDHRTARYMYFIPRLEVTDG